MAWRRLFDLARFACLFGFLSLTLSTIAYGQVEPEPDPDAVSNVGGVNIDAKGVLRHQWFPDPTGQLHKQRFAQARASLDRDIAKVSKLRKVSLNRLEAAIQAHLADGGRPTDAMRYLAGLQRIQYVFYYPETRDIVIAGPAAGWMDDLSGRVIGINNGRSVLELQDLIVALRAFSPTGRAPAEVTCSIDPTQEGLVKMQNFLRNLGGRATPRNTKFIVDGLRNSLGLQRVSVGGISPKTHFAKILVEADYRMKMIGIGLERPPVKKLVSYVSKANPASVSRNAMQRWYFVPDYECVRVADDQLAMQLIGDGVKLIGEDEVVTGDGSRKTAGRKNRASEMFVRSFTKAYPELASKSPVYAQLRNLVDMLVAAAFIQEQDYYGKSGWSMELFGSEQAYPVETSHPPQWAATAVNSLWKGNRLMTPIGGGVKIQATRALDSENLLADEDGQVKAVRDKIDLKGLAKTQWWWD